MSRQLSIFDEHPVSAAPGSITPPCQQHREATPPRARREDPETSQLAAARVNEFETDHYDLIAKALAMPGHIYDVAERTGLSHVQVARRLPEMKGRAQRNGTTKKGPTGRPCAVWELVTQ